MLDINLFRNSPEIIKKSQKQRGLDVSDVDKVIKLDSDWRKLKEETDNLRARRNKISLEINESRKKGDDISSFLDEVKDLPQLIQSKEQLISSLKKERDGLLMSIPNLLDKSVPIGDVTKNKVIAKFGE